MTSNSGPRKKKYNPLNKHGTFATRKDFIEADYINGVVNDRGEQVIRAMTKEEIEWLSQFYSETEHGTFKKTQEIDDSQKRYTKLEHDLRHAKKHKLTTEEVLELNEKVDSAYKELVQLRSETNTFYPEDKDRHEIDRRSYMRKNDIFNVAKASGRLISYDVPEFDMFTTKAEKDINPEHLVLNHLTRTPPKKKVPRKKKSS